MIKKETTIVEKSLFITAIALFALIIAIVTDAPEAMFVGILLIVVTLSVITVYLIEKEDKE